MADINTAYIAVVEAHEGFYSNDPRDNGSETLFGISRKFNPSWEAWKIVDKYKSNSGFPANMKNEPSLKALTVSYYKVNYFDKLQLSKINSQVVANKLFDIAVNMGVKVAAMFLQRALNVLNRNGKDYPDLTVDGIIGSKSITAANIADSKHLLTCLNALQAMRYIEISENNKSQEVFTNGWLERVSI